MMHDVIQLSNITKSFGGTTVLNNFSAEIPLCGVTVIRGASGAGKTTLFRLLLGLEKPDAGEILGMQGRKPAVVFQEDRLLSWATALENVALGSDEARADAVLNRLGLCESMTPTDARALWRDEAARAGGPSLGSQAASHRAG